MNIIEIGEAHGEVKKLIRMVCKKLAKGYDAESIAESLEEEISVVEEICSVAVSFAPEYDCEQIYRELHYGK